MDVPDVTSFVAAIIQADQLGVSMAKILRISDQESGKAMAIYGRYGSWSLLFSWVPIIGDPLCLVAGSLKLHPLIFSLFVFSGKLARYWLLAQATVMGAGG